MFDSFTANRFDPKCSKRPDLDGISEVYEVVWESVLRQDITAIQDRKNMEELVKVQNC
jgi:hypothetical protein